MTYEACHDHDEWVSLTDLEINYGIESSRQKYQQSGTQDRDGWAGWDREHSGQRQGWRNQALGGVAEQAVGKALGLYPPHGANDQYALEADLPYGIEVKLIGRDHYGLRIYSRTPDHFAVVGVVIPQGQERRHPYRLPGWIRAGDGKRDEWQLAPHGRPPFWAVPQSALLPLDALRVEIANAMLGVPV